jgi:hypothetical protein
MDAEGTNLPIRLNLGAGDVPLEGYTPIDRKDGNEVYPLAGYADDSVDVIRASHILEHFSHREVSAIINHWVSKLKPGGELRVAVPDLEWIAKQYLAGSPMPIQGYLFGGQVDDNDYHRSIFDRELLTELFLAAKLIEITGWKSEIQDCASLPVSLNLRGYKPTRATVAKGSLTALLSCPRYGPMLHAHCAHDAFGALQIPYRMAQGAYWHQILCEQIEDAITNPAIEYVITADYDSIFNASEVAELCRLMAALPHIDAICAIQLQRYSDKLMLSVSGDDGEPITNIALSRFATSVTQIGTGHFGLTVLRASTLRRLPRPWMEGEPNGTGRWGKGKIDPDSSFWIKWKASGFNLFLANRVAIGHLQDRIVWPNQRGEAVYQTIADYMENGRPLETGF